VYAIYSFPRDALLYSINLACTDGSLESAHTIVNRWNSDGAGLAVTPISINICDADNNVVQDLSTSAGFFTLGDLFLFSNSSGGALQMESATGANNEMLLGFVLDIEDKFGAPIFIRAGHRIAIYLANNYTFGWKAAVSGYFT
jgi:hypothetical protein